MPIDVGSRVRRRASFLGRRIDYVMEVVAMDPGRRLAMHAVEAPMPMDVTYEVEPAHGGAVARVRVQGDAGGLYRLAGPLISAQVGRSIGSDVERLRELLEADAPQLTTRCRPRAARSTAPPERRSDVPPVLVRPRSASCIECWAPGRLAPSWLRSSRRDS